MSVRALQLFRIGALLACSVACASRVPAQSAQRWSLQASGLHVGVYGDAYEGLEAGAGGELQIRLTPGVWSFGIGGQASSHGTVDMGFGDQKVSLTGVFIEPRRVIDVGSSRVAPYVSARLAYLKQSVDFTITNGVDAVSVDAEASGTQINGGGGLLVRLSPRVNLDVGATYGLIRFGDVSVDVPGVGSTVVDGSSGNGQNLVIRLGLAIGLGK
jgi:opacity protein-like surface antigen